MAAGLTLVMRQALEARARSAGFDLCGVAAVPEPGSADEQLQHARFVAWAEQGFAGDMAWLLRADAEGVPMRSSLQRAVPWARSVVVCAANYNADAPRSIESAPEASGWIARYAWSGSGGKPADYHEVLLRGLREVEAEVYRLLPDEPIQTRAYVDTGPVVERWFAQLAGIGWTGKNTCVLNQEQGSWLLLGVVLLSVPLAEEAVLLPAADRCGTCTRCIDACPTDALIAPRQMDASRCIAYLTIEKKGSIDEVLRGAMGRQVFGCDICQDVCPWNRRAPVGTHPEMQPRAELLNPSLDSLAAMDNAAFRSAFRGSPLERTGRRRLHRNVAIAMGNSGDARHRARLEQWSAGDDPVLAESALWALHRLPAGPSGSVPEGQGTAPALLASVQPGVAVPQRPMPFPSAPSKAESDAAESATRLPEPLAAAPGERELWPEPVEGGSGRQLLALLRYLTQTDVHTYAFSVAANVILSLFPFIVLLLTVSQRVFHSPAMFAVVGQLMHSYLPTGQDFVMRNMNLLVHPRKGVQVFSVVMLLISSTGVFLPLEVALNNVWRATKNRSYLHNQAVSLGLALAAGVLAMFSVAISTAQQAILGLLFFGHTENIVYAVLSHGFLAVLATASSITMFFLIYWLLPNRSIPARAVLPTAVVTGLLWEAAKHLYIAVLPHLDFSSVYGPFQISVGLMLWAFLSGLMLLAGAHFSATRHAIRMAEQEG